MLPQFWSCDEKHLRVLGIKCPSWKCKYIWVESQKVQKLLQKSAYLLSINIQTECLYTSFFPENRQATFVEKVLSSKVIFSRKRWKWNKKPTYRKIHASFSFFFFFLREEDYKYKGGSWHGLKVRISNPQFSVPPSPSRFYGCEF